MTIGERICIARVNRGWTQQQLSDETGIPRVAISKIESGCRSVKTTELVTIARMLRVKPSTLLEETREVAEAIAAPESTDIQDQPEPSRCPACGSRLFKGYGCTYSAATDSGSMIGWHCAMCCTTFETHKVGKVVRITVTGVRPIQLLPGELHDMRRDSVRRTLRRPKV